MFVAYHGVDAATHQQRFDELLSQGLRMTWVNVSGDPADARYAAVWVTNDGRGWAGAHNLDAAGYQRRFDELTAAGLTPSVVSASGPADRAVFAAIFEQCAIGTWTARHGLPWGGSGQPDTLIGQNGKCQAAGQMVRCLAIYGTTEEQRFAGVWWEATDGVAASLWLGDADFHQRLFDAQLVGGNRPSSLAVSSDGRVLSVFRGDQIGAWAARHRITAQEYQSEFDRQAQQGHRPIVVAAGGSGNDAGYAAVFAAGEVATPRQWTVTVGTNSVPSLAAELDDALADTMRRFGVRAAAIAVARAGRVRISRGYTWAEPGYPVTQPSAVFRQASVSKLFTAAAVQALHDDGIVGLDTPIFDVLGIGATLPAGQSVDPRLKRVTMRQAATRLSGMRRELAGALPGGATGDATMRDVALLAGRSGPPSQDDVVQYVTGMSLAADPGNGSGTATPTLHFMCSARPWSEPRASRCARASASYPPRSRRASDFVVARTGVGLRLSAEVSSYDSVDVGPSMLDTSGVWAPGTYGGSFALEPRPGAGGFATSVTTVARFIGNHAAWDLGARAAGTRYGDFHGTATIAQSRDSGFDVAVAFNWWVPDDAKTQLLARIGPTPST